ncbi:MAG: alpha/beta hydrolase [Candidatus Solibacter usitatus]|nr:alpha/beta hydrolase [Candidatus Solibacter usitatus]
MVKRWALFLAVSAGLTAQTPAGYPPLPQGVKLDANIAYAQYAETKLDVFTPAVAVQGKRPGVLVIHGGGWVGGQKEGQWDSMIRRYLEKGFVVASVEYRLAKAATAPAAVEDVLKAAEWCSRNASKYNVDKKRIVATGGSAGGHLSLMVGMTPKSAKLGKPAKVAAVVNFYGITDVGDQLGGPNMRSYATTWVPEKPGRLELARRVSPMTYVRRDLPPILTLHGDADPTVPYEHGVMLTKALTKAKARTEMISVPKGRHGFPKEKLDELYPQIFAFLQRHGVTK